EPAGDSLAVQHSLLDLHGAAADADRQSGARLHAGGGAPGESRLPVLRAEGRLQEPLLHGEPGRVQQLSARRLELRLTIGGATRLVGLIGDPVEHSLSPVMQNAAFAAVALDWAYVPLHVRRERLEEAVAGLKGLGFAGANVTIPHKTAVVGYCDELDEVAARAGSVNTLVVRDGRVLGSSTDGPAVVGLVEAAGARVLVLGAGGGAQAVATSLGDAGAESITIAARDPERAHALAVRLRTLFPEREI